MSESLEEKLLRRLVAAEAAGSPLTHAELGAETRGSTFEDLWASMCIVAVGQERVLVCEVNAKTQYVASPYGKWRLAKLNAERAGEPVPPMPPSEGVYMM